LRPEIESNIMLVIRTVEDIDTLVRLIKLEKCNEIAFSNISLKPYCFEKLGQVFGIGVINCNTSLERFCQDLQKLEEPIIFDNYKQCKNNDIRAIIDNCKSILVY